MGLDVGGAHWAYSGFIRFRERLAAAIGIVSLRDMEGFGGEGRRSWEPFDDPIVPLLDHSDCEGELAPEVCRTVAPRLKEIVSVWPKDDYDRVQAVILVGAMKRAARTARPLRFH